MWTNRQSDIPVRYKFEKGNIDCRQFKRHIKIPQFNQQQTGIREWAAADWIECNSMETFAFHLLGRRSTFALAPQSHHYDCNSHTQRKGTLGPCILIVNFLDPFAKMNPRFKKNCKDHHFYQHRIAALCTFSKIAADLSGFCLTVSVFNFYFFLCIQCTEV